MAINPFLKHLKWWQQFLRVIQARKWFTLVVLFSVASVIALAKSSTAAYPSFQGLGFLPNSRSCYGWDISADGLVIVGHCITDANVEAFRWTEGAGMVGLGQISGESSGSGALGVSADGTVIVGRADKASGEYEAFRWTQAGGLVGLGDLPGGTFESWAWRSSADGSVIVGYGTVATGGQADVGIVSMPGGGQAFRWTQAEGMQGLGYLSDDLPIQNMISQALDVSADGSVIVGESTIFNGYEAFRWTEETGMVGLGDLPHTSEANQNWQGGSNGSDQKEKQVRGSSDLQPFQWTASEAFGVSADGSVVVGTGCNSEGEEEAFRWTKSTGMVGLGHIPGDAFSTAFSVSADGSVVVGESMSGAFIWDQAHGMRSIKELLEASGIEMTGWSLMDARAVSEDGLTIVGNGFNPDGSMEVWIARLVSR